MGLFSFLKRTKRQYEDVYRQGQAELDYGKGITEEGLAGLRSLDTTFQGRLADPLGPQGRRIFERAQGAATDTATQRQRAFNARIFQLATQSGGALSPAAIAELNAQNQKGINEELFAGRRNIATSEATMTLDETNKLFDRMEGIRRTIIGVGQDERTRALQAIIASLSGRTSIINTALSGLASLGGAAIRSGGSGGSTTSNPWGHT